MKKLLSSTFLLAFCMQTGFAQTTPSAVRLGNGGEISNTIIYQNRNLAPVSAGTSVNFSALDTLQIGTDNVKLLSSPFSNSFRINSNSSAYNTGANNRINPDDSLDLDYATRVVCDKIDRGAYEFQVTPTKITTQPLEQRTCSGTPIQLSVVADGTNVTFQWFRNNEIMLGKTNSTLSLSGNISDTGVYHVIAYGDCCNDTSEKVRVDVDLKPALVAMSDTSVLDPAEVRLHVISSTGTVTWYTHNFAEVVTDLLITDIHHTQYYIAVAKNGVCTDSVRADVAIFVDGHQCIVKAHADTTICHGDAYLLQADSAFVNYQWLVQGTSDTLPKLSWYRPDSTTRLILLGKNELGAYCSDTLTVTVRKVELEVMADMTVCAQPGGTEIQLVSTPQADEWYNQNGSFIGTGNTKLFVESGMNNVFVAKLSDGLCTVEKTVTVTSNPPNLKAFPQDTTICEGDRVNLYTNVDPAMVTWTVKSTGALSTASVNPSVSTIYTATVSDVLCGNVAVDVQVNVQPKPHFEIILTENFYENVPFTLSTSPNASWWTDMSGMRVFPPFTLNAARDLVGWYTSGVCTVSDTARINVSKDTFDVDLTYGNGCFSGDGWAYASITGETQPYTYLWDNGSTENAVSGLNAGEHSVSVTDVNQKTITKTFTIAEVAPIRVNYSVVEPNDENCSGGRIETEATGGTQPYSYLWLNDESTGQNLYGATAGIHLLVVSDNEQCTDTTRILLSCLYHKRVLPNLFVTPNGDGKNDVLKIENINLYPRNRVVIINSYGDEVARLQNYDNNSVVWNGRNKHGKVLPDGVYWYIVEAEGVKPMSGWLLMKLSEHK